MKINEKNFHKNNFSKKIEEIPIQMISKEFGSKNLVNEANNMVIFNQHKEINENTKNISIKKHPLNIIHLKPILINIFL